MKGLILSGGTGTRLRPITYCMPKQLIPIANKSVLFYIIKSLQKAGIHDIGVLAGDRSEDIRQKLKKEIPDAKLKYYYQKDPLGLAHAVLTARSFVKNQDFIMILGDNMFDHGLAEAITFFYTRKADALVFLTRVKEPQRYGIANLEKGEIVSLQEKPAKPKSDLAIMGIYMFNETIFPAIARTEASPRGELEITDALQELINMGGRVIPYHYKGWWLDVGQPEDVIKANQKTLERQSAFCPFRIAPSTRIINSRLTGPLVIGSRSYIVNSEIGPYVSIGEGVVLKNVRIENSVLLDYVKIKGLKGSIKESLIGDTALISNKNKGDKYKFLLANSSIVELCC